MSDLEKCHKDQHSNIQSELRKEMALLQKKILMDTVSEALVSYTILCRNFFCWYVGMHFNVKALTFQMKKIEYCLILIESLSG